jgi:NADPH-dependent 2,4-dienoyl-CoA reductase/sulfur reductase-like enzyme
LTAAATTPGPSVAVHVDGRETRVAAGVSVAAALLDLGLVAFRRSVTGQARAPVCGMGTCFECRVTIDGVPHRRACLVPVADGMRIDAAAATARAPVAPGASARIAADVAVIGAGPAGIAAAARAAEAGGRVVLMDAAPNAGGQIWRHRTRSGLDRQALRRLDRLTRSGAASHHGVAVVDIIANDADESVTIVAERHLDGATTVVRAGAVVLATGARERFLPFPGWTLPGVVGIGGAQALLKQGASFAGKRVVIAGTGPLLLPVAASLSAAGARVRLVAEQAASRAVRGFAISLLRDPETLVQAALYRLAFIRAPYETDSWVAHATGGDRLTSVTVTDGTRARAIACDILCTGYGLVPNVEAARLLGCAMAGGAVQVDHHQATSVPRVFAAGEVTGVGGVALALVEGEIAGAVASGAERIDSSLVRRRAALRAMAARLESTFMPRPELRDLAHGDTIVCRCEDVTRAALSPLGDARQAKLYTRAGMGACQGRVCGPSLELLFGWPPGSVRSPLEPARLATLAVAASGASGAATSTPTSTTTSRS